MVLERLIISAIVCGQVLLVGCGAGPSPKANTQATAKQPAQQQATTKTAPSEKSPEQQPAADRQVDSEAEAEPESSNDPFRLVRTPKDIVTAGDTSFVFNFKASEVGSKADAQCQAEAAGDMQKKAACVSKRRDKFGTTSAVAVSRAEWPTSPGMVMAGAVEIYFTRQYGTGFEVPLGEDVSANQMFEYVALLVMAAEEATLVQIDIDGNGSADVTQMLNQGESYLVNGGIQTGATVAASAPVSFLRSISVM